MSWVISRWIGCLVKNPANENVFWIATLFLLLFGLYQIYAGLGMAARYILIDNAKITIRQNSLSRPSSFTSDRFESVEIRRMDILLRFTDGKNFRIKLGLRYPNIGDSIRDELVHFCEEHDIRIVYNYD